MEPSGGQDEAPAVGGRRAQLSEGSHRPAGQCSPSEGEAHIGAELDASLQAFADEDGDDFAAVTVRLDLYAE